MTEQEAKTILETESRHHPETSIFGEALQQAIKALEEIQQYRALGLTAEQIEAMQGHNIAMINDLAEYQALGTVEELKELKEKLNKIKYVINEKHYANAEECDYGNYYNCKNALMIEDIEHILND